MRYDTLKASIKTIHPTDYEGLYAWDVVASDGVYHIRPFSVPHMEAYRIGSEVVLDLSIPEDRVDRATLGNHPDIQKVGEDEDENAPRVMNVTMIFKH